MKTKIDIKKNGIWMGVLAFLIPVGILLFSCWMGGMYPFGDRSLVYHDMQYQYADFFMWFRQVLQGEESWNYSFHAGLGGNTTALVAYYLASPLNFLLLLVPAEKIAQFFTLLIILKLALCGVTAYVYLRKLHLAENMMGVFLSVGYALMGYNILQCSNVMWLDGVIILPILALGIHKMIYEKKCGVYFFALFYAIASNWYMGYMLCIFACIYFLMETCLFYENKRFSVKETAGNIGIFAGYSILAVLGSCFLFLPQTLQMMKQGEPFDAAVLQPDMGFSYLEGFRDLYLQSDKLTQMDWIPPIFVGTLVLLLTVLFFAGRSISRYKKIVFGTFLLGFLMLLCFKPFNYLFTGLKIPNNHYFRQAFLFSFLMLVTAGYCAKALEEEKVEGAAIGKSVAVIVGVGLLFDMLQNYQPRAGVYVSCVLVLIVGGVCAFLWNQKKYRRWGAVLLLFCMTLEFSAKLLWEFEDHVESVGYYTEYNRTMEEEIEELKNTDAAFDMYRVDKTLTRSAGINQGFGNEGMSFGYSSVAQYASTDDMQMKELLMKWGYGSNNKHLPYYPVLPMDSLLGVKYIYSRNDVYKGELLKEGILGDVRLYENPYALPIAFEVDENCGEIAWSDDAFSNHEKLYSALLGYEAGLYNTPEILESNTDGASWRNWKLEVQEDGPLYLYFKYSNPDMTVHVDHSQIASVSWYNNHVIYAGEFKKGDIVEVMAANGTYMEDYGFLAATLRMENFEKAIASLKENKAEDGVREKTGMTIKYQAEEEGRLLFTIPYDKGWKVTVNNEETEAQKIAGNFMAVDIKAGENVIEFTYSTPGLLEGCMLSVIGFVGFAVCEYLRKRKMKFAG